MILAASATLLPPAQAAGLRIGSVESIAPTEVSRPRAASAPGIPGRRELRFDAFGRRFELQLEATPGLAAASTRAGAEAMQGTASGFSGSWVRLTKVGDRWVGLIFDGVEYFALDSAGAVRDFNDTARRLPGNVPVMFRLRDTVVLDASFAGDLVVAGEPLEAALATVNAELPPPTLAATLPTKRLDVAVVIDADQAARDGTEAEAQALARMNVVDGIFANQVGVTLKVASTTTLAANTPPFDATTVPKTLLEQLRDYRVATSLQQAAGLSHLFTGRNLDGDTVGIAYIKSVCNSTFAASLSEGRQTAYVEGLIAAHEIGHVFGAPHDGDTEGACAAAPTTFLMAPQVNGNSTFSECSLQQIAPVVTAASCLAPSDAPDASLGAALQQRIAVGQASTVRITVQSNGNATVAGVHFTALLPAGVDAVGAGATGGGTCAIVTGRVDCSLGDIPAGQSRDIEMSLLAKAAGNSQAALSLTSLNDSLRDNDTSTLRLQAMAGADLGVSIVFDPTSVQRGASTSARVVVRNNGLSSASDLALTVTPDAGLTPTTATVNGGLSCSLAGTSVTCAPSSLAAGATAELLLGLQAGAVTGQQRVVLQVSSATLVDPQPGNNNATGVVTVTAPPPPPDPQPAPTPANSGGGGGGAFDEAMLAALSALTIVAAVRRRLQRQRELDGR